MANIYELKTDIQKYYNMLESGEYIDQETGEIIPDVANALALTEQNLQVKAQDYGFVITSLGEEIAKYENAIKVFTERKKALEKTQERLKNILSDTMQSLGIIEIKGDFIKLSFRKSESVEITDESKLPREYMTEKVTLTPNKTKIKQDIKEGVTVEGAELVIKNNLQIKV